MFKLISPKITFILVLSSVISTGFIPAAYSQIPVMYHDYDYSDPGYGNNVDYHYHVHYHIHHHFHINHTDSEAAYPATYYNYPSYGPYGLDRSHYHSFYENSSGSEGIYYSD